MLAILDEFVVDLQPYINEHPGGRFSLEHNIGRDLSKFFYGAYALENQESAVAPYTHSSDARLVVDSLIVGRLEGESQYNIMNLSSAHNSNKTGTIKTISFVTDGTDLSVKGSMAAPPAINNSNNATAEEDSLISLDNSQFQTNDPSISQRKIGID